MRIALDAMGSDEHPAPDVAGAVMAARELGIAIVLVGDEQQLKQELEKHNSRNLKIDIVHADDVIDMGDRPSDVIKSKNASSMHVGLQLVKEQSANGFVTVGNTGVAHAVATLKTLRRIPGIKRPALSAIFPIAGRMIIFVDVGANTDSKPEWLAQYAIMGSIYAERVLGIPNPQVALLSNGEEEGKGNALTREADILLRTLDLNYIGNAEPQEVTKGRVDVLVSDGFAGNVLVKTFEASTRYLADLIRDELSRNVFSKLSGLLAGPAFRRVRKRVDTFEVGGAPLLGVNGVVIVGHGRSNATAIKNAINQARQAAEGNLIDAIQEGLQRVPEQRR